MRMYYEVGDCNSLLLLEVSLLQACRDPIDDCRAVHGVKNDPRCRAGSRTAPNA